MLNSIIKLSLRYRTITIALALVLTVYGSYELYHLPIDVFPDLNRPRVTVMTECPGLAPEEVETLVTFPLESSLNGATGVQAVRSSSGVGLSVINVEFAWGTDIFIDRQIVAEKLALAADRMPKNITPHLAPISSIMGQIMLIGISSEGNKTDSIELRTLSDWVIRQRLLTIPGVAQVITMGGGRKQYQVLANPEAMLKYDVTLQDIEHAVATSNANATGGYLEDGGQELLIRSMGRLRDVRELDRVVVKSSSNRSILLNQVATIREAAQVKRGEAAVNGSPAVMIIISKQPGADTRAVTSSVIKALDDLKPTLPADVQINPNVYQQKEFIDLSIRNVIEALRDGGILVVIVLFLFLLNFRTTFITLTAIPLSIVVTGLVFKWAGMSINTMTLGGLAVAIGELVDDAIVDVENIFRRLRENKHAAKPKSPLRVVYEASSEVRNSIVFSTILVVLVFIPLFALGGMEGRLFTPLGIAYIVSIIASLFVSLTVTPVLSYWLLPGAKFMEHEEDGFLLRWLKWIAGFAIRLSVRHPWPILATVAVAVAISLITVTQLGRDFLPPFNEGSVQVNVILPPGTSLATSDRIAHMVDERIAKVKGVVAFGRRTGRAELDEHAEGVNMSEIIISFDQHSGRDREEVLAELREELTQVPGVVIAVEQPLQHLISHMLSGIKAQVGIKLYGDDLTILRRAAKEMEAAMQDVPGVKDLMVEQQVEIPQLQIELNRDQLARYGLSSDDVNAFVETALNGRTVSEIVLGERKFDLVVRLDDAYRSDLNQLERLSVNLPDGGRVALSQIATIRRESGPNTINRENVRRRIIIQCNTAGRDLNSVVTDIQAKLKPIEAKLPLGYVLEYGGQFESQRNATRMIGLLSLISLAAMFLALYTLFGSTNLALQVLSALPMAAIGAVAALVITGQSLTVASMVGFISLSGIASRNGILLIAHYLHLVKHEGEQFIPEMIERAGKERLAPMLMTALTAGIALVPLVLAAGEPGKEILYPVATVILGGLISSTLLDFFVHPALFWCFGRRAAELHLHDDEQADEFADEPKSLIPPAASAVAVASQP
ncbi:Cobalt-zinc-cadmium resistance protein CzcA [Anatilimnocola aggregata]|uniref:Cobalt-zinc-cadmium resistance protein CzcA n=1 Tax=Anatilimnocola aggregata TaxID=2528021 RepID=A0A517Y9M1_9BACT|nr:efflux RND transporter permease subunit [Anatilimnocola aggregata]QDU26930.1 Cobalt-zinc-cadmium resistance protein CzcA [Anatilimnocola aggregata]